MKTITTPRGLRGAVRGLSAAVQGFAWTSETFLRANDLWKSS